MQLVVVALRHCLDYQQNLYPSGWYLVDPDGTGSGVEPFLVHCNMSIYPAETLVHHDYERKRRQNGGSVHIPLTYENGVTLDQLQALVDSSGK